ncbi:hypothetical protein GYH30_015659 [Glycine max]|nr:hypothetical protein GYH30_015659 [Glycine max]
MNALDRYERFVVPEGFLMRGTRRSSMRRPSPLRERSTPSTTSYTCSFTETPMSCLSDTSFLILFNTKLLSGLASFPYYYYCCLLSISWNSSGFCSKLFRAYS